MPVLADLHFIRPWWLLALVPLLLVLVWLRRAERGRGAWQAVCDAHLIPFVLETGSSPGRARRLLPAGIAGVLAIIALAGPAWQKLPQPVFSQEAALVILMDLSRSMDAGDIKPSRLQRSLLKLQDLLKTRREGQTALVAYAGDAFAVTPLTNDTDTISSLVQSLSTALMPVQGSRPDRAVEEGLALLAQAGVRGGSLLLITDGVDEHRVDEIAAQVVAARHRLSVLGAGTPDGAPIPLADGGFVKDTAGQIVVPRLDGDVLARLAAAAGGVYAPLDIQEDDIERLNRRFEADLDGSDAQATLLETDRWREEGPWLLLLLLPLAALAFRKGLLLVFVCVGAHWTDSAQALGWDDVWFNADQRGMHAMEAQEYAAAAGRFSDPRWRAAALYRSGDFEKSAAELEGLSDPQATYNRGNALARAGRIDEAIESYRSTLGQQPGHEDARYNLELLEQLKDQQQQQSGKQGDSQQQEQQSGEQDDSQQQGRQQSDAGNDGGQAPQSGEAGQQSPERQEQPGDGQQPGSQQQDGEQDQASAQQQSPDAAQGEDGQQADPRDGPETEEGTGEQPARPGETGTDMQQSEEQQAMEQWLRRVPDDPGGLLRRKFRHQYSQRDRGAGDEVQAW